MDTALELRLAMENGKAISSDEINGLLNKSKLVKKLTTDYIEHPLSAVFRIIGPSEIPYVYPLPYTQKLVDYINRSIATDCGFSCLGGVSEFVPCYNAMLLEAYCRLGLARSHQAQAALAWIKQYQLFDRDQTTSWPHKGVCKHGGCLGRIPCYIGIGKTVRALLTYLEFRNHGNKGSAIEGIEESEEVKEIEKLIAAGANYMLRHQMFQRLSDGKPISAHITDIMLPQSYALSLTDLVYIVGKERLTDNPNTAPLMQLLKEKQVADNQWKIDYIYSYKGYTAFETRRRPSEWVSALFALWLGGIGGCA